MEKPFSQACENNKKLILAIIADYFEQSKLVLEIGSGTGQHASYFARKMPHLFWQTSDQLIYQEGINLRVNEYTKYNLGRPMTLDVTQSRWPIENCDGIFTANTSHIMNQQMVDDMFIGASNILTSESFFCLYGPFKFDGKFTSKSNEDFDQWLKGRDPESGIRDFERLEELALDQQLNFVKRFDMPANNCILVWQKNRHK